MSTVVVPPGDSPPIAVDNARNHSGSVVIATALGLCFVLLFLVIRLYIRTRITPPYKYDDYLLSAATVSSTIQSTLVFLQVARSFGMTIGDISPQNLVAVQKIAYANDFFYLMTLYLSKISVIFLFMRLTPDRKHTRVAFVVLLIATVWVIASIFMLALRCNLAHPWLEYNVQCTNLFLRWQIIGAWGIFIEICIFCMSIYLVIGLQTSWRRKSTVIFAFGLRLPVIGLTLARLHYVDFQILSSNPTLDGAITLIWTQVELDYSIIAATIPCLKPFMTAVNTQYGAIEGPRSTGSHGYGSDKRSHGSFGLNTVVNKGSSNLSRTPTTRAMPQEPPIIMEPQILRPDKVYSSTRITHDRQFDTNSTGSNDSTKMIIKKEVQWTVKSEPNDEAGADVERGARSTSAERRPR